jgi:hypothetical protein
MDWARLGLLALAAAAAGVINSIAGGGSIISFPAAIAAGLPPVVASATNTVALAPGSLASAYAFRGDLGENRRFLPWLVLPAAAGALIGALVLVAASERVFELVVPWLVLLATLLLLVRDILQKRATSAELPPAPIGAPSLRPSHSLRSLRPRAILAHARSRRRTLGVAAALGVLSIYGGYFGAGMGILTLAVISFTKRLDIHQLNALKNIVVGAINTTAAMYFVISGTAHLPAAAAMAIGAAAGGYFAARIARRIEPRVVSWVVAGIGVALSAVLAARYWV